MTPIGAEDTAVPRLGSKQRAAALTSIQNAAGILRHRLLLMKSADGAADRGLQDHVRTYLIGWPNPPARSLASSGPIPAQHSASCPSIATEGTVRIPRSSARVATCWSFMSSTVTSQDGQARRWTSSTVFSQAGHPAVNTSTLRLPFVSKTSSLIIPYPRKRRWSLSGFSRASRIGQAVVGPRPSQASVNLQRASLILRKPRTRSSISPIFACARWRTSE